MCKTSRMQAHLQERCQPGRREFTERGVHGPLPRHLQQPQHRIPNAALCTPATIALCCFRVSTALQFSYVSDGAGCYRQCHGVAEASWAGEDGMFTCMAAMVALLRPPHASSEAASAAGPSISPVRQCTPSTSSNALHAAAGTAHACHTALKYSRCNQSNCNPRLSILENQQAACCQPWAVNDPLNSSAPHYRTPVTGSVLFYG